jgi:hypothetical protein|tara:strand:- start:536 stop:748 length:213 start_codon:yes stop_codon:yes gene_type:complete
MWFPLVSPLSVYVAPFSSGLVPSVIEALDVPASAEITTNFVNARNDIALSAERKLQLRTFVRSRSVSTKE